MLVFAVLGAVWAGQQPAVYTSTASLRIGLAESPAEGGEPIAAYSAIDELAGELEVLQSRQMAALVIKQFQLQIYPEFNPDEELRSNLFGFVVQSVLRLLPGGSEVDRAVASAEALESPALPAAIDRFLDRLRVERVGQSRVVRVSFSSRDATLAARVANALPEAYLAARHQARVRANGSASDQATERYLQLKEQLTASERAEAYYRSTFDLDEAERLGRLEQQLTELDSQLRIAQLRKSEALSQLEQIQSLSAGGEVFPDLLEGLVSPAIARLFQQRAQLSQQMGGQEGFDPDRDEANADIAAANPAIRAELDRLVVELQAEAASASDEAIALEARLAEVALASSTQHRRLLQLRELEKETAIVRLHYEAAADRLRESTMDADAVTPDAEVISVATASSTARHPGRAASMAMFLAAGLSLGLLLVFGQQLRNPGLLSPEHVHFLLGESTIGVIPEVSGAAAPHDLVVDEPASSFTEAVNALKITLDLADIDHPVRAVQMVSAIPGEGRAALSVAVARAEAAAGRKVLLVSAHLRHSSIEDKLGIDRHAPGLTDLLLSEQGALSDFVRGDSRSSVEFLSAGTAEYANPDVVFSSQRMLSLVGQMRAHYDFIVFDTPPVMTAADAIAIGRLVDKTLFVVRWNRTPKRLVARALEQLRAGAIDIAGVVLQHVNLQRYGNIGYSDFGYLYHQNR